MGDLLARGAASVEGLWLYNVTAVNPVKELKVNADQLRTVFFDVVPSATGSIAVEVTIDRQKSSKNPRQGISFLAKDIGKKIPMLFYYPFKYRSPGVHTVEITVGHMETKNFWLWSNPVFVPDQTFVFSVVIDKPESQD